MRQVTKVLAFHCHVAPMIPGVTQNVFNETKSPGAEMELLPYGVWLRVQGHDKKLHERVIPFANLQWLEVETK